MFRQTFTAILATVAGGLIASQTLGHSWLQRVDCVVTRVFTGRSNLTCRTRMQEMLKHYQPHYLPGAEQEHVKVLFGQPGYRTAAPRPGLLEPVVSAAPPLLAKDFLAPLEAALRQVDKD